MRLGGVAGETCLLVGPTLHVAAALGEAGVDAFSDLPPFVVVDDLGRHDHALHLVVEGDVGELACGDLAVHGAHGAHRLAAARRQRLGRPFFEVGLRAGVVADLARAVRRLGGGDAGRGRPWRAEGRVRMRTRRGLRGDSEQTRPIGPGAGSRETIGKGRDDASMPTISNLLNYAMTRVSGQANVRVLLSQGPLAALDAFG